VFALQPKPIGHGEIPAASPAIFLQRRKRAPQFAPGDRDLVRKPHPKEKVPFGKIDINTATEKELRTVPGIGPVMAARIIAARPFRSANDLRRVSRIGDKKYAQIRPYFQ
jgi:DNA uptake protein ComE-like DNA-binding protein